MRPVQVLFLCRQNSARSQMAEAFLRKYGGEQFVAESAGIEEGTLNPLAIKAMQEIGIDISNQQTKTVQKFFRDWRYFHWVIRVCDIKTAQQCPIFPFSHQSLHWDLPDPAEFSGSEEEKLQQVRLLRDQIERLIQQFIETVKKNYSDLYHTQLS